MLKVFIMARVTVEDCLENVENRYQLVHLTAQRTRQLYRGANALVKCKNKQIVTALREIAEKKVRPIVYTPDDEDPYTEAN